MKKQLLFLSVILFLFSHVICYGDQFSSSSFNCINDIAIEGDLLWCATNGGVIQWNKNTGEYKTYTTPDGGVYGNSQRFVEVDRNGIKWFGSNNGVITFDGDSFKTVTDEIISDIFVGSENAVWIFTSGSIRKIAADTGNEIFYEKYNQNFYGLRCVAEAADGTMWFGSGNGVYRFDGETWQNFSFDSIWANEIKDIAIDGDGVVWAVTNGGGILCYNMEEWTIYTLENNISLHSGYAVCVDENNIKWFAPSGQGLISYDNSQWEYHKMDGYSFRNLIRDGDIVWSSSGNIGVIGFNDSVWTNFSIPFEKIQNIFTSAVVAPDNTKWFGSDGFGVYAINENGTFSYTTDNGLPGNTIESVGIDENGSVWVKSDDEKFARFDGSQWETFDTCSVKFPNYLEAVTVDETWIADYYNFKLTRIKKGESTSFYESLPITSVAIDANGHIWAGGKTTIAHLTILCFDGSEWTSYPINAGKSIDAIVVDHDNTVWICTDRAGIWHYDRKNWRQYTMNGNELSALDDVDDTVKSDSYFPMAVGNYWLYKHQYIWEASNIGITDNLIMTIMGTREIDGVTYYKFLDGRLMRTGDDGNVYSGNNLFYDLTSPGNPYNYEVPGNYATRALNSVDVPIGTCEGYDFTIYFWEHGYHEVLAKNLGMVYYRFNNDTGGSDTYELSEAYINGVKYTEWETAVTKNKPAATVSLDCYPNPFNPQTTIGYTLPNADFTKLVIYNMAGQKIRTLISEQKSAGSHSILWDGRDDNGNQVSSGIYIYHLKSGEFVKSNKMMLMK